MTSVDIRIGDCLEVLRTLPDESVHCVVSSPPYWGQRDYKIEPSIWGGDPACPHEFTCETVEREIRTGLGLAALGERYRGGGHKQAKVGHVKHEHGFCTRCGAWRGALGLEPTWQLYVAHIVEVFREVRRVLRKDGTLWLNLGDCYATGAGAVGEHSGGGDQGARWAGASPERGERCRSLRDGRHAGKHTAMTALGPMTQPNRMPQPGLKPKDLVGIPWRVAFALQDDGWFLRQDIIWQKANPMPESVTDRPTTAHEHIFLLSKSGNTLCWRHRDGRWVWTKPEPDYIWRHRKTREERREPQHCKDWIRVNLWRGYDYWYDAFAIMEPSSPNSHARAARSRSTEHKWADACPQSPQTIAVNPPVAGRLREVGIGNGARPTKGAPNGAAHRPGRNSRVHVDRVPRSRKLAPHDGQGPRIKNNENYNAALGTADLVAMRNKRSVWTIATEPFKDGHFATFAPALVEPCVLAGCPEGGTVLDPFAGAGTVGLVAHRLQRHAILIERNPDYAAMAERRIREDAPLMAAPVVAATPDDSAGQAEMFSEGDAA